MRSNKWIIFTFVIGLLILIYPHVAQIFNNDLQKKQVNEFKTMINELPQDDIEKLMDKALRCNEEIFDKSNGFHDPFEENKAKLQSFKQCLGIEDDAMFGAIEIPKLKLLIPIYLGSSEEILSKGVGHVEGSSIPIGGKGTRTVLAGHRGMWTKAMFRNIDELHDGDVFYIHSMDETLEYKVYKQQVIYPDETDSLAVEDNKDLATLLTCHPYRYNYQRLLIHGERIQNK